MRARPTSLTRLAVAGLALAGLAVAVGAGCATGYVAQRPYPAPAADAVLKFLAARQAAVVGADLETRTTSWLGAERTRATVLMLVDRAGRLRFEAEIALQGTVATLVTDGKSFALADYQSQLAKRGPACPENVAALVPVPLRPDEIAAILLGDAPIGPGARVTGVAWDGKARADVLTIARQESGRPASNIHVSVRPLARAGHFDVVAVEGDGPGGKGRWRVAFDEREEKAGYLHPGLIRFAEPGRSFEEGVEIKVKERRINPAFRPQAFTAEPPQGFPVEMVACPRR